MALHIAAAAITNSLPELGANDVSLHPFILNPPSHNPPPPSARLVETPIGEPKRGTRRRHVFLYRVPRRIVDDWSPREGPVSRTLRAWRSILSM